MIEPDFDVELVLDFQFDSMDCGTISVRDYLKELLVRLLQEGESFSGKRPFGNSGWEHDLAGALIATKAIDGTLDEDARAADFAWADYHAAVKALALAL